MSALKSDLSELHMTGDGDNTVEFMESRHARLHAAFFLPHLTPGLAILDCGCGPGAITLGLAEAVAPGTAVGIDVESTQIDQAETLAHARGIDNARFKVASVYELPFDSQSFDRVFCNALMEYLAQPEAALEEMHRILKPGGLIGVCSPDWGGFIVSPRNQEIDQALAYHRKLQTRNGGDPTMGSKLGGMLSDAGYGEVSMAAYYECHENSTLIAEYLAQQIEADAAEADGADAEEMARTDPALRAMMLRNWAKEPVTLFAQAWVSAVGRR
jgi:ubiquinone/menaquinone biosynthesis C-methylase UbiE